MTVSTRKELQALRESYARKVSAIDELLDEKPASQEDTNPIPRGGRIKAISDAAHSVMVKGTGPLRRESILEQIEAIGVPVQGDSLEKKLRLVSSALSKDARFKSAGRSTGLWHIDYEHAARKETSVEKLNGQPKLPGSERASIYQALDT